jgi:glyoxylase-like metal-dependent hydrolase (beta-lactamase superfamily II)
MAYLINGRFLASGDLLRISDQGKIPPFLWHINMNHRQNIASIKKMLPIIKKADYLLTGHSGARKI